MRKQFIMLLMQAPLPALAQTTTTYFSNNVNIKRTTEFPMNMLSVGEHYYPSWYNGYRIGVHAKVANADTYYNVALHGDASADSNAYSLVVNGQEVASKRMILSK